MYHQHHHPFFILLFFFLFFFNYSLSQSISSTPSTSLSLSLSSTTALLTVTISTTRQNQPTQLVTVVPAVFNVTHTITPTPTSSDSILDPSSTPQPTPIILATKVDPAFAVLGVILILTGLPSAFWGHKNRWTSFFLIGFYTLSLVCIVLILKFGVIPAINPPSRTLRGMFVLSATIAGIAGGAISIFFWKGTRYGIGAWGGFALALWIQSFRNGGLIRTIGFRWILYIGCGVIGFTLSTIPKIHYHVLLISTAFVGATSFILGVDCFTTAGLKEFYIWNLGFPALFPKYVDNGIQFPVSQTMQIELGLIGAVALMGIAVQLRILKVLQKKMLEIAEETKRKDEEAELSAAGRFSAIDRERDEWEKEHPTLSKHGRQESSSTAPLMKDSERSPSPEHPLRDRHISGLSDFKVAPTSDEEMKRASRYTQVPGALPALDLGLGIQEDVPPTFMAKDAVHLTPSELEDFKRKHELLAEIQTIRRSIDVLKSETPIPSSSEQSRRPSFSSRRTLSMDASNALLPTGSHIRPPRETDPRARVHSMEFSSLARNSTMEPISRPTSVPLKESDWDQYIQERKLLQPPTGITPPIATTPMQPVSRVPLSPAVQEAINRRKRRESALALADQVTDSSDEIPLARGAGPMKSPQAPVTILPPRRSSFAAPAPQPPATTRVKTFEELNERHREKMRDIQAPLTQAEKEHAQLEAARQRWERSKALEKEAVMRRQAEKAAALEKRKKSASPEGEQNGHQKRGAMNEAGRHSRSLSADKLATYGTSSTKRISMLKVEDWQRYQQQDLELGVKPTTEQGTSRSGPASASKRESRSVMRMSSGEGVPFPNESKRGAPRSKSRDYLS